jgi:DNA polymerase
VLGVGPKRADWLVIGEAPGAEEDRRGEPFVGAAGQLLDAMLRAIGLDRKTNVYIANVLKSRPPNNRDPKPEEVEACLPYLARQIRLLEPKIMLAVGRIAAQNLLATDAPLGRLRGRVHHFGEQQTPLIVTYHPAYLLRTPADKRKAWEDLKFARSVYQQMTQGAADGNRS